MSENNAINYGIREFVLPSWMRQRPERIIAKMPMQKIVLSSMGDVFAYSFTKNGIEWYFLAHKRM